MSCRCVYCKLYSGLNEAVKEYEAPNQPKEKEMKPAKPENMKVSLVYVQNKNGNGSRVDSVYLLPHTARARASKLRAQGWESFVVRRSLRGNGTLFFTPEG